MNTNTNPNPNTTRQTPPTPPMPAKLCKHCKQPIARNAKVCPYCRKKQGKPVALIVIICVVAVIIIAAIAGGGNDEGVTKVDGTGSNASGKQTQAAKTSANEGPLTFTVGETAQYKGINVTFVEVKENEGDTFNKPSDGNKFVLAVFEIENKSDEQFNFSSIMCSEAYYDGYSVDTSLLAGLGATESSLDGDCAPGKKLRGYLAYELPADYKELEIQLQLDIWDDEKIVFVYNND